MNKRLLNAVEKGRKLYKEFQALGVNGKFNEQTGEVTMTGQQMIDAMKAAREKVAGESDHGQA